MAVEIKLPEVGENIEKGTVAKVLVSAGQTISEGDVLLELETDKAVVEIPAEVSGTVQKVLVSAGEEVKIGQTLLVVEPGAGEAPAEAAEAPAKEAEAPEEVVTEAAEKEAAPEPPVQEEPPAAAPEEVVPPTPVPETPPVQPVRGRRLAPAAPSVRRFAREIGIDINEVPGSGPGGRISVEDVKRYAKQLNQARTAGAVPTAGVAPQPLPDFSKWGEVERRAMSNVRRKTAEHLSYAWSTIPHVTNFDKADITELEKLRKKFAPVVEKAGGKLTVTAILLKVVAAALKKFPQFNASIDMEKQEIIYKKYYHIGVAVDTPAGLLVPVIRDVDRKNIVELSVELTAMAEKARQRKLSLEDMQGGNFSISNLGGIGGTGFTPIVNAPEVAILGVSRAVVEPVWQDGKFKPRLMLPLSLSYDHRLIDGADAARFLRWVAQALEQPFLLSLEG